MAISDILFTYNPFKTYQNIHLNEQSASDQKDPDPFVILNNAYKHIFTKENI